MRQVAVNSSHGCGVVVVDGLLLGAGFGLSVASSGI